MKEKTVNWVKKSLFISMVMVSFLQIILGVLYLAANFGINQTYAESGELIGISKTFLLDEYTGILYPLLLAVCRAAERVTSIPFLYSLDVIQLAAFFGATLFLIRTMTRNKHKAVLTVYLTCFLFTVPFLMQMNLAALPYSPALSCFEILLGSGIIIAKKKSRAEKSEKKYWVLLGASMVAESLFVPDSFWLGVLFLGMLLLVLPKRKENIAALLLTACVSIFAVQGVTFLTVQPGSHGKIQNSFEAAMVSRFVWPNFATNYFFWDDEIKSVMTLNDAVRICQREDEVSDYFGPMIEKAYGRKEANQLYLIMAERCLHDRTKESLKDIAEDFRDYLFMPFTIERNLSGSGTSENAWNYSKMRSNSPELTKYYCRYGLIAFDYFFLIFMMILIEKAVRKFKETGKKHVNREDMLFVGNLMIYAFWFTMRSNSPVDYKMVLPVILIWYLLTAESFFFVVSEKK